MSYNILRVCKSWIAFAVFFGLGVQFAPASNRPLLSGMYEIVHEEDLGAQAQIQMHIHLVNHGSSNYSIQRMTLWNFSHPEKGGTQACSIVLRARQSADATKEFTISRADYEQWRKGLRPRLVLRMGGPGSSKGTAVVRLDRISVREVR